MAGNTRFHSKFHFAQHHSEVTGKNTTYPDATTDPIASEDLPFQGDFHSDGVLKITALDATRFNYFGNDVHVDSNLHVTNNTTISGDLEVVGNVVLKANPAYTQAQRIQIGDDKGGIDQIADLVTFVSYVDSDFSPISSRQYNLGEHEKRWWNLYVNNINLDGEFKIGTCKKDGESIDKGLYIDAGYPGPRGRLGINTCSPNRELDVTGDMEIHGDIKLDDNKSVYWDSLSANNTKAVGLSGSPERLTIEHPDILELSAPNFEIDRYDVNVKLKDSQNALTVGDCLTHYDELNNRVGIHTCNPTVELDIVGNYQLSGDTAKTYTAQEFLVNSDDTVETISKGVTRFTSDNDMQLTSTANDISLQASKTVQTIAKDISTAARSSITMTAGASTVVNSPTLMTTGKRFITTADTFVKFTAPTFDIDVPEIDFSSQNTSIKLKDDIHALNVHDCMLKFDTTNRHVGINVCEPTVEFDVAGDVLLTAPNSVVANSTGSINLSSGGYSSFEGGNVGINTRTPGRALHVTGREDEAPVVAIGSSNDYFPRLDLLDKDTTDIAGSLYLDQEIDTLKLTRTASRTATDGLVIDPDGKIGIGTTNPTDTLNVVGTTFLDGTLKTSGTVEDQTLIPDRVVFKDNDTLQNTTTDEFYYDGIRAAIGHLPDANENAMLYVAKGPVKLASTAGKEMTIQSTSDVVVDGLGTRDMSLFQAPLDHSYVIDIPHTDDLSTFSVAFREQTPALGVYDPSVLQTKFYIRPKNSTSRAFFGFNTTDQTVTDDSSGHTQGYDVIINQDANINNNLRVGNDLHVEDNTTVDGMLTVNSENEQVGVEVRSDSGARVDLVDTTAGIDYSYEFQSHKNLVGGEIPGTGSTHASTISNATNDHMVLDLRNTSEDHRFALRYSSNNDGVADKIVMAAGHYIYNIDNPDYDSSEPTSSTNPLQIPETRQGHVGINCVPTQDYHLDVNGNMRITGNFVVDGASTQIQAANLEVEDKNITLNITPGGVSTTASTFNAGILIIGDSNEEVGYVKVHPVNIDQLVAKAPTGQEVNFDINGATGSLIRLEESTIDLKQSTNTLDDTTANYISSTILHEAGSNIRLHQNSTLSVEENATLVVETDSVSRIDQDLTKDSLNVEFDGLYVHEALTIPTKADQSASWAGSVRFNTSTKLFEGNTGTNWVPFSTWLTDDDGDTYIKTETSGGVDNDEIEFYVDGELVLFMNKEKAEFTTKYGFTIPAGNTATRPGINIVQPGSFRFNTEYKYYEGYDGDDWMQVGGVIDLDRDTYWTANTDPPQTVTTIGSGSSLVNLPAASMSITIDTGTRIDDLSTMTDGNVVIGTNVYGIIGTPSRGGNATWLTIDLNEPLVESISFGTPVTITTGGSLDYPGDPDILRAFTAGTQALEIGNNTTKFFNDGVEHLDITSPTGGFTRFTSTGLIDLNPGGDVNIHQHGAGQGLRLANKLVTSSADQLNRSDITAVGQSENNKVVTQSQSGVVTIGQTQGNQMLNIASHDEVDAGLKLAGTLVTANADEINVLDGITSSTKELNYLDIPSLTKADLQKLADVNATAAEINDLFNNEVDASDFTKLSEVTSTSTQLNFLTASGLTKADLQKLADINATADEINDLYTNAVDASDFTKLSQVTSSATDLNYMKDVTPGTATSSTALVTDANRNIGNIKDLATTNTIISPKVEAGSNGVRSTGNIVGLSNAFISGEVHSSSTSDARLKLNLEKISNPLEKLNQISGYNFDWDKEAAVVSELAGADTGVVAQEVEKVVPEAVVDKANGYKGVKYEKLIPLLIECVKDQQKQIDDLKAKLGQ